MTRYRHHTVVTPADPRREQFDWNRPALSAAKRWRASLEPIETAADRERHARDWHRVGVMRQALLDGTPMVDAVLAVRVSDTSDGRDWIESLSSYGRRFTASTPTVAADSAWPVLAAWQAWRATVPAIPPAHRPVSTIRRPRPGERGYYPESWSRPVPAWRR